MAEFRLDANNQELELIDMRINTANRIFSIFCMVAGLSACSIGPDLFGEEGYFRDRQGDYLEAGSIPRLQVPNDMDAYIIDDLLVIPDLPEGEGQAYLQVPRPRPIQGNPGRSVVIQRMEDRSWIVVDASASQVWSRVRQYWLGQNIDLVMENTSDGLLDTSWYTVPGNEDLQQKIRIIVQPGFQDDSAEISLLQLSGPQGNQLSEQVVWPEQSMDTDYAYEVLADLSSYLASEMLLYQASTVSFLATSISSEGRARLERIGEEEVLHLDADFERSWAAVGRALERAEIAIVDEDIDARYFNVAYTGLDQEEQRGFFGRLLPIADRKVAFPFRVYLQENSNGIDVIVINWLNEAGSTEGGLQSGIVLPPAQMQNLRNSLLEAIQEFIS